ncbi:MAG: molybdopterin-binding protein [Ilumatobacteraceae bacterium]
MNVAVAEVRRASRSPRNARAPRLAELVCLTLIDQGASHGWALVQLLSPRGEIGQTWPLSRALTYRAIDNLINDGHLNRREPVAGNGGARALLDTTPAGHQLAHQWLRKPVPEMSSIRDELPVKLAIHAHGGVDPHPLLAAQRELLRRHLPRQSNHATLIETWRTDDLFSIAHFLDRALTTEPTPQEPTPMKLSARNQLNAIIDDVQLGEVMATVKVTLPDGQHLTAAITRDSAEELELAPGDQVVVVIKSTEVMIGKPD